MSGRVFTSLMSDPESVIRPSDKCKKCGGSLTFTGTKMNPATHGKYRSGKYVKAREGSDELVTCEACGWTWWVHRA